jgi:hypothetical protein
MGREQTPNVGFTRELDICTGLVNIKTIVATGNAVGSRNTDAIGSGSSMFIDGGNKGFGSSLLGTSNRKIINLTTDQD